MVKRIHTIMRSSWPGIRMPGLLLAFLLMSPADLHGQRSPFNPVWTDEAAQIREEVECLTDRSLYIVEELIRFRTRVVSRGPTGPGPWSTVLYVELVSMDGTHLVGAKFRVHGQVSSGEIRIPADLLSGTYYLRTYTRWMRNWGPESFTYLPIRIINPHRPELYPVPLATYGEQLSQVHSDSGSTLELLKPGSFFTRGDSVDIDVQVSGGQLSDSLEGCFSIVPLVTAPSSTQYSRRDSADNFRVNFLPDRFGPSLSGSVQYPDGSAEAFSPAVIHFTLMGENAGYFVCRSDAMGRFSVGLPMRSGKLEIFVLPESPEKEAPEVWIDQDFDPRQIQFPGSPIKLTEQELIWAAIMARNVQLSEIYGRADSLLIQGSVDEVPAFYGSPSFSVDLDQYVLLPTLREVFLNFVPSVTPVTRKGKTSLLIESVNPSLYLYETLVMVDQVPVLDMEQFWSMSPAKIKQIDVIEDVYVKGDLRFGGVVNLHSRDGDMAGIDLRGNSFFIDYLALQPAIQPQYVDGTADDKMPDTRNTILWLPKYVLHGKKPARISFVAPQYPGEYVLLFRGYNHQGELIQAESTFEVR